MISIILIKLNLLSYQKQKDLTTIDQIIFWMQIRYQQQYRQQRISATKLSKKILALYEQQLINQHFSYDELLFVFDMKNQQNKCDRQILRELFNQACDVNQKCTIKKLVETYIDNVQTSKLCLIRTENKIEQAFRNKNNIKDRKCSYVFLKVVQASIFSRFTKNAVFSYKITPSNIPEIMLQKALNPILDHQFTLQLEHSPYFNISFYQSGILIYKWTFPESYYIQEGEYIKNVRSQNIQFVVKLNILPKQRNLQRQICDQEIKILEREKENQKIALSNLCRFTPFVKRSDLQTEQNTSYLSYLLNNFTFFKQHVKNLHALLIVYLLLQCLFSYYDSIEFIDIIIAFYILATLYESEKTEIKAKLFTFEIILILCILKTIWGLASASLYANIGIKIVLVVLCIAIKVLLILATVICLSKIQQVKLQSLQLLLTDEDKGKVHEQQNKQQFTESIWQSTLQQQKLYI